MAGPHDRFFKKILSDPRNAAAELHALLSVDLVARIGWNSLWLENATFIDESSRHLGQGVGRHPDAQLPGCPTGHPVVRHDDQRHEAHACKECHDE
jgi:hypothetical protein